jgi:hypothetical protein
VLVDITLAEESGFALARHLGSTTTAAGRP